MTTTKAEVFGHKITGSYTERGNDSTFAFKLYINGDLRDQTDYLRVQNDWTTYARAGIRDDAGATREVEFQAKYKWWTLHYRLVCDDSVIAG